MQIATLAFVFFTSLVGTFIIIKTLIELFFADKKQNITKLSITNCDQAEYLIRTALITTDDLVEVTYMGQDPVVTDIINRLARENPRVLPIYE